MKRFVVWIAQGFGVGRIPVAPGTFGSLLGLLWGIGLLATGSLWLFAVGTFAGLGLSVWACGIAEHILGERDPGSVVLDEIAALPLAFLGWLALGIIRTGEIPPVAGLLTGRGWLELAAVFALFRGFDIWKPWPIRPSQALPGGWGITVDDVLAALLVNLLWPIMAWAGTAR